MMGSTKFLDYEVALLLARHGKSAVLQALASKLALNPDQLEKILQTPPRSRPVLHGRRSLPPLDLVKQLTRERPNKAHLLQTLYERFENRAFLPEFRDVKRFFEEHSQSLRGPKSRAESAGQILRLLAELDVAELEGLCQAQPHGSYSSLGVISDEILRGGR